MSGLYGFEKFLHLEDKIYRTIELIKRERKERELLDQEVRSLRRELVELAEQRERLEQQVERLMDERDAIKTRVEAMLDAVSQIEEEDAEAAKK